MLTKKKLAFGLTSCILLSTGIYTASYADKFCVFNNTGAMIVVKSCFESKCDQTFDLKKKAYRHKQLPASVSISYKGLVGGWKKQENFQIKNGQTIEVKGTVSKIYYHIRNNFQC